MYKTYFLLFFVYFFFFSLVFVPRLLPFFCSCYFALRRRLRPAHTHAHTLLLPVCVIIAMVSSTTDRLPDRCSRSLKQHMRRGFTFISTYRVSTRVCVCVCEIMALCLICIANHGNFAKCLPI